MPFAGNHLFMKNIFAPILILAFLAACGDNSQQEASKIAQSCETSKGVSLEPRYSASLSEGIAFGKAGYPDFISCIQGISVADSTLGRWTDGIQSEIKFVNPLPEKFVLKISAGAAPYWQNIPIQIIVGTEVFKYRFGKDGSWTESQDVAIPVNTDGKTRSIIFKFPDAKSPYELRMGKDHRKLALFLISIKIEK